MPTPVETTSPSRQALAQPFLDLPKIELHCHLDGAVQEHTLAEIAAETGIAIPETLHEALVVPEQCLDLGDYLRRFDLTLQVMQRPQDLFRIAVEMVEQMAADGTIYGEVRFAPQLHRRRGLSLQQVLDAVHQGLQQGSARLGVRTGLIVCCLRHEPPELSLEVARLASANQDKVCALDLAGDEARYAGAPHAAAFDLARDAGLRRTVHAGEGAGGASVEEALDVLHAERIGHGVRLEESGRALDEVKVRRMAVEMCPRSNVQTRSVAALDKHPIDRLLRSEVHVTVSTDSHVISETSVSEEFGRLKSAFGWGLEEFWRCQQHAVEAAFVTSSVRAELQQRLATARAVTAAP